MSTPPKTAMVMAAGLGTRMRPLTDHLPKPLIKVAGKPMIDGILERLADAGVERAVVNVHAFAEMMAEHIAARERPRVVVSDERERLLGTGGGLKKARALLGDDPIWVANSDYVWWDGARPALDALSAAWDPERMDALLLVLPQEQTEGLGDRGDFFLADDGRLTHRGQAARAPLHYVGFQILKPSLVDDRPDGPFSLFEVWMDLQSKGRLFGVTTDAFWMQVGDPAALAAAEARLAG